MEPREGSAVQGPPERGASHTPTQNNPIHAGALSIDTWIKEWRSDGVKKRFENQGWGVDRPPVLDL